jgi:uncharacterized Zn-binding protein involved in type VI secretion
MVGDTTTHGGVVITGSPMTNINGIPIARKGDKVFCPLCPPHTFVITEGLEEVKDEKVIPVALHGHLTSCGATLIAMAAPANAMDTSASEITENINAPSQEETNP